MISIILFFLHHITALYMTQLQCFKHVVHDQKSTPFAQNSASRVLISQKFFKCCDINHFHFFFFSSVNIIFSVLIQNFVHAGFPITMVNVIVYLSLNSWNVLNYPWAQKNKKKTVRHRSCLSSPPRCHPEDNLWYYYLANCLQSLATIFNLIFLRRLLSFHKRMMGNLCDENAFSAVCKTFSYSHTKIFTVLSSFLDKLEKCFPVVESHVERVGGLTFAVWLAVNFRENKQENNK